MRDQPAVKADIPAAARQLVPLAFIDLQAQRRRLGLRLEQAMARVMAHGAFIMGPEVAEIERRLAAFCGARHAIACASGTDALVLALMAKGIGRGDAVVVPAFTFAATAEAVVLAGATPVFADVLDSTATLDPASLEAAIGHARALGLNLKAAIAVDLFGHPADYPTLDTIARAHGLTLIADAAQSFGSALGARPVGTIGDIVATSFYPAKPLGCYGDGGAVFTADDGLAARLRTLRLHGRAAHGPEHDCVGLNSRLDTLQAAILIEKLAIFPEEIAARQRVADRYEAGLRDLVEVPRLAPGARSVWAQYTIRLSERERVAARLAEVGIPTAVYYARPLHRQAAYRSYPVAPGGATVAEQLSDSVLSLPMHAYLDEDDQDRIIAALRAATQRG
jgi:dTDP-4-amino-4,6-dideoxygalactose transaminase